jgi:hypothetical protein
LIWWFPSVVKVVTSVAWPKLTDDGLPIVLLPSKNVTVPCETVCEELTVAVMVTLLLGELVNEGFRLDDTVVAVEAGAAVVMVIVQPELIEPGESPAKLSNIYRLQVPFGVPPLKVEVNVAVPFGAAQLELAGAGDGKLVQEPVKRLVGLNVPLASTESPHSLLAESSRVSVILLNVFVKSQPLRNSRVAPFGPTNRKSRSAGKALEPFSVQPFKVTVILEIVPDRPDTAICDGYGLAFCGEVVRVLGVVMGFVLLKDVWA